MKKTVIIGALILISILIILWIYRYFFEFNNSVVKGLIRDESQKYSDPGVAANIIHESVMHILNSRSLTSQVRAYSAKMNIPKEKALVDAGASQAQAYQYLNA